MAREFVWSTQMLSWKDCVTDPVTCAWGACFPTVLFARNVNRITDGQTTFNQAVVGHLVRGGWCCWCCCIPSYAGPFREQLRKRRNLPMDPYSDKHAHMFCHPCALCQEARELDAVESTAMAAPKNPTIDRHPPDTEKHLEGLEFQKMDR